MKNTFIPVATILLACGAAFAQDGPPSDSGPKVLMYQTNTAGLVGPVTGGGVFFSAEIAGNGKPVTGAPYTATASTEMTQVLGDGNRIVNKTAASLARDSQGRTRREETMGMVGPWQVNGPKLVFINDPATQTNYILDVNNQLASVVNVGNLNKQVMSGMNLPGTPPPLPPPPPGASVSIMTQSGGNVMFMQKGSGGFPADVKTESLGVQTMEGVSVEGKRATTTIPAGQIGNVQPIETVSEVWFSPELQAVVMSKHSDPRFGETVYQLTGIQRAEPDHSLFEVPPGYTIKNGPGPISMNMGIPNGAPVQIGVGEPLGSIVK
jgi:hypothetical protein